MEHQKQLIAENGYVVVDGVYSDAEIAAIQLAIQEADTSRNTFRKTDDLFAIRQFLKEVPAATNLVLTDKLKLLVRKLFGSDFFVVKSIYFDKPVASNWFVAWHQDLTISVKDKLTAEGYGPWTVKQGQFAVQPPLSILESNFTIRIHLDDADAGNGALKVIPGSHRKGIYRPDQIDSTTESAIVCDVKSGGVMVMRPLLMHASGRTTNNKPRKVIHIEFSRDDLAKGLSWAEKLSLLD
ncbi:phytanoyl-CoA dioxygenase [Mucilaginibacter terrenus]|uniref:Phytanoyl-CoA dioxygenase n=1 Tax=Mucilaginibacter terrenus TaxID=2482727 RepID=A0A3E2NWA3_9SPHI|nr:phytanoyl-CoA dioxygenase family protein [Mucilaginibacter terrenus]RFZ85296.1 phytanoyl-CoA dioxygenase [Mucilaginibacter terrenus]